MKTSLNFCIQVLHSKSVRRTRTSILATIIGLSVAHCGSSLTLPEMTLKPGCLGDGSNPIVGLWKTSSSGDLYGDGQYKLEFDQKPLDDKNGKSIETFPTEVKLQICADGTFVFSAYATALPSAGDGCYPHHLAEGTTDAASYPAQLKNFPGSQPRLSIEYAEKQRLPEGSCTGTAYGVPAEYRKGSVVAEVVGDQLSFGSTGWPMPSGKFTRIQ